MANENVIQATFDGFYKIHTKPSWLIDHGMELSISGIDLPDEFECHFSNSRSVAAKRQIGENGVVTIPDEYFLSNAAQIFCWIYLHPTVDSGVTEYEIVIPLLTRPNVDPAEPTQEQQDIVDQAIAALNVAMAETSADAESASASATAAQAAVDSVLNMTVSVDTLPSGSDASVTKSVVDDAVHLAFGIPQGAQGVQGEQGVQGPTGATPNFTIGTVQTLLPTQDATATITGTAEAPVLNLGIPKGYSGDATNLAADYSSNKIYAVGEYCIYNGSLYRCTTPITTAETWTAAHWTAAVLGDDVGDLKSDISNVEDAIDYVSPYLAENDDFINGVWANGTWRTDGNYGKYKSNKDGFELENFTVKASTTSYTNLVISITCFDENNTSLGNFITNNNVIQNGSYAVTKTDILNSNPTAKYISIAIGKTSGSTYYDLPSDIVITVEKTNAPQTIADRVTALEAVIGSGTSVVVAQNGGGDYNSIEDAVNGITDDSASKPYTILIKNGVYDEHVHVGGDRYLSFVGENRETCIIRSHTGMYTDAPLWIDGNFTIENLTLQMLDDEAPDTWTPGTSQSDPATMLPGYALHIDGGSSTSIDSIYGYKLGVVRNCTLYSVAFPAIGAGLHANQKLIFDCCDFIRNTSAKYHNNQYQYYTNYSGAMIMHDSTHSGDANQNLDIINCRFICNLGKSATFRFKYGSPENVKYAMIDNTFWCAETSSSIVDSDIQGSVLLGYSHGNNNTDFNA